MKRRFALCYGLLWCVLAMTALPSEAASDAAVEQPAMPADSEFAPQPEWPPGHYARIETSLGRIVARLLPEQAPQSVAHFAALAEGKLAWTDMVTGEQVQEPYYDGIPIHNVRAGLLFEAGDWTGTGKGAPPLYVPNEGAGPVNFNGRGRLGMARPGPRPSAVQFFVTYAANPQLNNNFPCFGVVMSGIETVFEISQSTAYNNGKPVTPATIHSIRVFAIGTPAALPEPEQIPQGPRKMQLRPGLARD